MVHITQAERRASGARTPQQEGMGMATIYGYCRVSTRKQNIERQVENIIAVYPATVNHIYKEAYTGTKVQGRKELDKLLTRVTKGDTIVFDSVSRFSRNAQEGMDLYIELFDKGINLVFLKESYINTDVYRASISQSIEKTGNEIADCYIEATNKVIRILAKEQVKRAFEQAQKEVTDLQQRTKEGIRVARDNGKQIGAIKGSTLNVKKKAPSKEKIRKYCKDFGGALTDTETIKQIGISRNTYYKYKKELIEELTK